MINWMVSIWGFVEIIIHFPKNDCDVFHSKNTKRFHMRQRWKLNKWTDERTHTNKHAETHKGLLLNRKNLRRANLPQSCAHSLRFRTLSNSIRNESDISWWLWNSKSKIQLYHHHHSSHTQKESQVVNMLSLYRTSHIKWQSWTENRSF